eukprot:CAMPEP_0175815814 /NCGR_PEP_ID=MMETSP0107_2-20121207/6170_1 /TAXON_ID=195067 ORGANISM="Goniomonas pacifica, Strain CCMP1869" /NCGR_SAMPLE_ID=MMETSP0107_2 /ASSEMBLY_ACC=CAM_ASM_000203 /LENGTH=175 /DNA_ID=CAMNT_0017127887 /DNA_START=131 /DNA_END=658 /DNA_ORIENTATION=+
MGFKGTSGDFQTRPGAMMIARLTFAATSTFIQQRLVRAFILGIVCILCLTVHVLVRPFRRRQLHSYGTVLLSLLCAISMWEALLAIIYTSQGNPRMISDTNIVAGATMVAVVTVLPPLLLLLAIAVRVTLARRKQDKEPQHPSLDETATLEITCEPVDRVQLSVMGGDQEDSAFC